MLIMIYMHHITQDIKFLKFEIIYLSALSSSCKYTRYIPVFLVLLSFGKPFPSSLSHHHLIQDSNTVQNYALMQKAMMVESAMQNQQSSTTTSFVLESMTSSNAWPLHRVNNGSAINNQIRYLIEIISSPILEFGRVEAVLLAHSLVQFHVDTTFKQD
ncbi:hypothetical protein ACS0TY_030303 [Phlomoides rotata]